MARIDELCIINMGQSPESSSYNMTGEGIPFFQGNADFGEIHPKVRVWCKSPKKIAHIGDILISVRAPIGAMNVVNMECCIGRGLAALTINEEFCCKNYIWYALTSRIDYLIEKGTGSTFKAINKNILAKTEIKIPSMVDQKRISSDFDKLINLIALRKQQLAKLDELVKSRFIEMFGDPETNPYGWKQVTLNEVCSSIVRGPFGSTLKKEFFVEPYDTTYKVYEQKHAIQKAVNIGTYYVTAEKYNELKRFECKAGDILMSCSGTMGELYQLPDGCEKGIINQALCKFTLNEKILPVVFLTYMKQTIGNLETKGSGIKNIAAVSYVKSMPINLPPFEVQNQFAAFVEQVDKSKFEIQKSLQNFKTLKIVLMQKYFR